MTPHLATCPCGTEVGYGSLSTPEERARGLCSRCEAGDVAAPDADLVAMCQQAHALRSSGRADWGLEARIRLRPEAERRAACRVAGIETM